MLEYITENEYKKLLGREDIPENFKKLVIEASSYINHETFGRIDENDIPEQLKYTTCLIIEKMEEQKTKLKEIQNLKSENIEGWSKTYITPEEIKKDYSETLYEILSDNLWNVIGKDGNPLLYRGVY